MWCVDNTSVALVIVGLVVPIVILSAINILDTYKLYTHKVPVNTPNVLSVVFSWLALPLVAYVLYMNIARILIDGGGISNGII